MIRPITRNQYIQQSIKKYGFQLPTSENSVMKLIYNDFDEKRSLMAAKMKQKIKVYNIKHSIKFSMMHDEYTTVRRRHYFSVNLYDVE